MSHPTDRLAAAAEPEAASSRAGQPPAATASAPRGFRFTLRGLLLAVSLIGLLLANGLSLFRLRQATSELAVLRAEVGYLGDVPPQQVAAVRLVADEPLTWRARVRTPEEAKYRVAYSAIWPADAAGPQWFAALPVPAGESVVTAQIRQDPRDDRWKIITLVQDTTGTRRMATALSEPLAQVFRESHDVIRAGIGRQPVHVASDRSLRLLDERWLVGEGSLLLYGDAPARQDQPGIFVELQPDTTPL